jgi:hypothetical protein
MSNHKLIFLVASQEVSRIANQQRHVSSHGDMVLQTAYSRHIYVNQKGIINLENQE